MKTRNAKKGICLPGEMTPVRELKQIVGANYVWKSLKKVLEEAQNDRERLRRILSGFFLMKNGEFKRFEKLWGKTLDYLGDSVYEILRISLPAPRIEKIEISRVKLFIFMIALGCIKGFFRSTPIRTLVYKLGIIFETHYSIWYLYRQILEKMESLTNINISLVTRKPRKSRDRKSTFK